FGACLGEESPQVYNERASAALLALDDHLLSDNFFLIDKGRTPSENAVVLVEAGEYRGYGFVDLEELNANDIEGLMESIEPQENNPEVRRIIRRYMASQNGLKIVRF
nr:DNA polymerase III subunit epsilon [Saprospiraceae bacterium]